MQRFIAQRPDRKLAVLVVWEPILPTDWTSPSKSTLARISDSRARQFWDPDHLVSRELKVATDKHSLPAPNSRFDKGFYWDQAILYGPHTDWNDDPAPVFWNGPVVKATPLLANALKSARD